MITHKLIMSDNLPVLIDMVKTHKGLIDLIIIDPPYNTNNDKLTYADAKERAAWVRDLKARLELAKELLSERGLILVNIDEYEFIYLKLLMNQVFGQENSMEDFIWEKNSVKNNSNTFSCNHEYIPCYAKNKKYLLKEKIKFRQKKRGYEKLMHFRNEYLQEYKGKDIDLKDMETKLRQLIIKEKANVSKGLVQYKYIEEDTYEIFRISDVSAPGGGGGTYEVLHPITGKPCKQPKGGWRYTEETMRSHIKNNLIYFGKTDKSVPQYKRYLKDVKTEVVKSVIQNFDEGKKDLEKILPDAIFSNPKPVSLIKFFIDIVADKDSIILDFYAGTGTTGQAVIEANEELGRNNQFILITNNEENICTNITKKRIEKVIEKYNNQEFEFIVYE